MSYILIDSDVLIDVLRRVPVATAALADAQTRASLAISVISRMETVIGSNNKESLQRTEKLLRQFTVLWLPEEISRVADDLVTRYYLSRGLRIPDACIAATALVYGVTLLSKNQRDFEFIPNLQLLPYPTAS